MLHHSFDAIFKQILAKLIMREAACIMVCVGEVVIINLCAVLVQKTFYCAHNAI